LRLPKLKVFSGRSVCALLLQHGFVQVRQRGSHIVMQKSESGSTTTVPIPDHNELRIGTLLSIIRQSGLPRKIFEAN
jgi:predicted RNA binding protein YcfA (HicA-like mRNA interferase family)